MLSPSLLHKSMDSWSRTEPPGCTMAVIPQRAASSTESGNGKYASEAITAPLDFSPARSAAMRTQSTRLGWPPPMPTVASPLANTIELDFTYWQAVQANFMAVISSVVGCFVVATFQPL